MSSRTPSNSLDVSTLPTYAFGHRGLIWWGTTGYMVIEGSMFVIVFIVYFYLRYLSNEWPPSLPLPDARIAGVTLAILLVSCVPNQVCKWAAERMDLRATRRWLMPVILMGVMAIALRAYEYPALKARWDSNAYGSIVWVILSLHTIHLVTDVVDSMVLLAMLYLRRVDGPRFVDLSENSLYWYFIVLSTIPVYAVIYLAPRVL
jgi:cytochrome c oxidase subunit III